ncbi:hypothetical protein LCGC14_1777830, partial [marine sediment metagenome]
MDKVIQILSDIGWPTDVLTIDFETYFDTEYTLKKMGIAQYVADSRFEFTGLGLQINDEQPRFVPGSRVEATIDRLVNRFG